MAVFPDGPKIRRSMEDKAWSQLELALEAGVSKGTAENCTSDYPRPCYASTQVKIARVLGVDVESIRAADPDHGGPAGPSRAPSRGKSGGCIGRLLPETQVVRFVGRDDAPARISAAWSDPRQHLLSIIGVGGQGKTALVKHWMGLNASRDRGAAVVLTWTFDGQGQGPDAGGSEPFLSAAWDCFFDDRERPADWFRCADLIAEELREAPVLLVLDGVEVLQSEISAVDGSRRLPASEPLGQLLRHLAEYNPGLCILTSRCPVGNLIDYRGTTAPELRLEPFDRAQGAELLQALGVRLAEWSLRDLSESLWGHPLSVKLVGSYLVATIEAEVSAPDAQSLLTDASDEAGDLCALISPATSAGWARGWTGSCGG